MISQFLLLFIAAITMAAVSLDSIRLLRRQRTFLGISLCGILMVFIAYTTMVHHLSVTVLMLTAVAIVATNIVFLYSELRREKARQAAAEAELEREKALQCKLRKEFEACKAAVASQP